MSTCHSRVCRCIITYGIKRMMGLMAQLIQFVYSLARRTRMVGWLGVDSIPPLFIPERAIVVEFMVRQFTLLLCLYHWNVSSLPRRADSCYLQYQHRRSPGLVWQPRLLAPASRLCGMVHPIPKNSWAQNRPLQGVALTTAECSHRKYCSRDQYLAKYPSHTTARKVYPSGVEQ